MTISPRSDRNNNRGLRDENGNLKTNISHNIILIMITFIIIFIESILTLLSFFRKEPREKIVLTKKTNFGFDIVIKD